ncbi:MAG TPA: hypothetical protein VN924_29665 [Bryobacteraceae bacterium]|nr:hypothetical protein [Bryobacteraceae bacterium]
MKTLWAALLVAGMAGMGARAETSQLKGRRIVDEALAALGGQAFLNMQNRVETGRIYSSYNDKVNGMAVDALYTKYLPRPDQAEPGSLGVRVRDARGRKPEDIEGKRQDDVILYMDGAGYEVTFRGARPLSDITVQQFKTATLHNIFYILRQRLGEPGIVFDSRGADFFENRPVEVVDITDANNETVTVYFDQLSKLPSRQVYFRRDPIDNSKLEEATLFNKYRDVGGGVMWPFSVRNERNGEKVFERYSESVEINQDFKESMFTLPPGLRLLKKDK